MKCDDGNSWTKVCKAAVIRIYEEGSSVMVSITQQKEPQTVHFQHAVPKKETSHLGHDGDKLWCRWMIQKDAIQGDHPLFVMAYFENKEEFDNFGREFTKSMT